MVKSFKSGKIFGKGQEKWKGERQDLIQKAEDLGDGSRCVTLSIYNSDASLWSTAGSWAPVVKLGCNTLITWSQKGHRKGSAYQLVQRCFAISASLFMLAEH